MNQGNCDRRRQLMARCRQVVVKAGTRLLTDHERIRALVRGVAGLRAQHRRVLLVTSGAVGMGMRELGLSRRPRQLAEVQALAAIGQCKLMAIYREECARLGFGAAQLLLTAADLRARGRYLNVMNCINALWDRGVLPIVNENDSVSVDELKFSDNDQLSAQLATLTGSPLTIILTTEQGLRERNEDGSLGARISVVEKLDPRIKAMAGGTDNSEFSIGGMSSKLLAAELVTAAGEHLWIADGRDPEMLDKIARGEDVGTLFVPGPSRLPGRKRWLRFFARCSGALVLDDGAARAVGEEGRSLLPSGVVAVRGTFKRGDSVELVDGSGRVLARGLVNYSSAECELLKGLHTRELVEKLGCDADSEFVHRDQLVKL